MSDDRPQAGTDSPSPGSQAADSGTTAPADPPLTDEQKREQKRAAHAAYMRRWRARRSGRQPPPSDDDAGPGAGPSEPGVDPRIVAAEKAATAYFFAMTEAYHSFKLYPEDPRFGEERSRDCGEALAPYLAELMTEEDWANVIKALAAIAIPTAHLASWRNEVLADRKKRGHKEPHIVDASFETADDDDSNTDAA